jgi:hypothetical protein
MRDENQAFNRVLGWLKFPLTYYRDLFNVYRLEDRAVQVPVPKEKPSAGHTSYSMVLFCTGESNWQPYLSTWQDSDTRPAQLILVYPEGNEPDLGKVDFPVLKIAYNPEHPNSGRNQAFRAANQDLILYSETGLIPEPQWTDALLEPLEDPEISLCAGEVALSALPGSWVF